MTLTLANGTTVCLTVRVAQTLLQRCRGLLGRPAPLSGEGLLIMKCSSIHTIGMRYPIDVIFVDKGFRVLRVDPWVPPGLLARRCRQSAHVIEMAAGQAAIAGLEGGAIEAAIRSLGTTRVKGTRVGAGTLASLFHRVWFLERSRYK